MRQRHRGNREVGRRADPPEETRLIVAELERMLDTKDDQGQIVANAKFGVYAFYDYDGEPIYVGQTTEQLRVRIRRHLTNQRTDAVAMHVLDPFEVADVEMWPFWTLQKLTASHDRDTYKPILDSAEYTVFQMLLRGSSFGAVLNEVPVSPAPILSQLPRSLRGRIVPDEVYKRRLHADLRLARRASTIAKLAEVISERSVQRGLRATLLVQAARLYHLAGQRLAEAGGPLPSGQGGERENEDEAPGLWRTMSPRVNAAASWHAFTPKTPPQR